MNHQRSIPTGLLYKDPSAPTGHGAAPVGEVVQGQVLGHELDRRLVPVGERGVVGSVGGGSEAVQAVECHTHREGTRNTYDTRF